eukprot:TRINITY_DN37686_c0_g1_i1.p2 TRINITY_DN37686_c0_g1~~TRINITY_DN37686_c0_g1_i1.p2  ORF type:complete len:353 (+),score=58.93 TRINITY_DN37686_c0_g1_i1:141-1061(+)
MSACRSLLEITMVSKILGVWVFLVTIEARATLLRGNAHAGLVVRRQRRRIEQPQEFPAGFFSSGSPTSEETSDLGSANPGEGTDESMAVRRPLFFTDDAEKMDELPNYANKVKCHPQCMWECGQTNCDLQCKPSCQPPKCVTACKKADVSKCRQVCSDPQCTVVCPTRCASNSCPGCHTVCGKPQCSLQCGQFCESKCADPVCTWQCAPNTTGCPKPQCSMRCDGPKVCGLGGGGHPSPEDGSSLYLGHEVAWTGNATVPPRYQANATDTAASAAAPAPAAPAPPTGLAPSLAAPAAVAAAAAAGR